ncbi:MAG: glycosyltransferase family 4 protein [Nanoarchaeota archaeon]|nr:glycosyltransferase family 4 protein [Nanoarchaeota archaeon]
MEICIITPLKSKWYKGGGVTKYAEDMIRLLKRKGVHVEVITYKYPSYYLKKIKIHKIPFINFGRYIRSISFVLYAYLYVLLNRDKLPKLFSIQLGEFPFVFLIPLLKFCGKTVSVTFHLTGGHKSITNIILRKILVHYLNKSDNIIAVSNYSKEILLRSGVSKSKIKVIYNGVNTTKVSNHKYAQRKILFFGRLSKEKGIFTLLDAARVLTGFTFYIVGKGPLYNRIKEYIKHKKIKNVKLLGYLPYSKLKKEILSAEMVVFPSLHEAFPIAILETMSYGKPVIATNVGGIPEMIKDGKNGILIKPNSVRSLTRAITKLHNDKKLRIKLSRNATNTVKKIFAWDTIIKKILNVYMGLSKNGNENTYN